MSNLINVQTGYPDNKNHWYNIVVDTQDEKYKILKYARTISAEYCVSGYYDKYMIELSMDEMQRQAMKNFIAVNIK